MDAREPSQFDLAAVTEELLKDLGGMASARVMEALLKDEWTTAIAIPNVAFHLAALYLEKLMIWTLAKCEIRGGVRFYRITSVGRDTFVPLLRVAQKKIVTHCQVDQER